MPPIITVPELAKWARMDIPVDDIFANVVIEAASLLVRNRAQHPEWDNTNAPDTAKLVTALVSKRTYTNPDQEIAFSVGPISSRVIDEAAAGMRLTDAENEQLDALVAEESVASKPGLWIQPTTRGDLETDLFLFDSSGSDWAIPYLTPVLDPYDPLGPP